VLNVASLGNLNRQFVSILRSEQDTDRPITGNPTTFATLLSESATLATLDEAFAPQLSEGASQTQRRAFPYLFMARWVVGSSPALLCSRAGWASGCGFPGLRSRIIEWTSALR